MGNSLYFWVVFHAIILLLISIDLFLFRRDGRETTLKKALIWSSVWVGISFCFNYFIYLNLGYERALEFFTCYLVEKSLSIDNLFVFCLIFSTLKIQERFHHKVLYWGVIGALVMRITLILIGVAAIERFEWLYMGLGAFLLIAALRLGMSSFKEDNQVTIPFCKSIINYLPSSIPNDHGQFFVRHKGRLSITTTFVALILIEVADIIFALDSLPAVLGITTDMFIVYTSNVLAILGLRSLYFVLLHFKQKSAYFTRALSAILLFVALKMLLAKWIEISVMASLVVVLAIFSISYLACRLFKIRP